MVQKITLFLENIYSDKIEVGVDEAGRGCLAGPVFAAAVILPKHFNHPLLKDSKTISQGDREIMRKIIEKEAINFYVAFVDNHTIDKINILNASIQAMHQALNGLTKTFERIVVDGNKFKPYKNIPHQCIIKGDSKHKSISAASILAKTYRDDYMISLAKKYPIYQWEKNKGYPTSTHIKALQENGFTDYHRITFKKVVHS